MSERLRLGISPCPNDTFLFHALLEGESDRHGLEFAAELVDIEALNEGLFAGRYDLAKVSFAAALAQADRVTILPAGSALGFGVGPIVLASPHRRPAPGVPPTVLCPGEWTTATLLWRLLHPEPAILEQRVFSEILPALRRGEADLGVCIHESRFTWPESGLACVEDLGRTWEEATGVALPLGGIAARSDLGPDRLARAAAAVRDSLAWGLAHRTACLPTMRRHAQEETDEVLWKHVALYVNEWTLDLGSAGRTALRTLSARARARGLLSAGAAELAILSLDERRDRR
ncbi:MAG: 1,4-dihydroxy-6-naphthoate synthase [Planctomycetota bacterium]